MRHRDRNGAAAPKRFSGGSTMNSHNESTHRTVGTTIGIAALVILALGVSSSPLLAGNPPAQDVEITQYEGERLGSVDDFRENSIRGVQRIDAGSYSLLIDGLVEQTASHTYQELLRMPHQRKLVTIHCVEGWSVKALWEGIPLRILLEDVAPINAATTVIFHAADGYTTSLPLETILERNLIIADRLNGLVLPPANGFPFQLVAEDKLGYKWIRWLTRIELSSDSDYRGFWETRGYNNGADIDGPILER